MPAYLDEKHLSKYYRQYNDVNVSGEVSSTGGLEVMGEVRICSNVEKGGAFAGKISWSGRFRVEVG